MSAHHKRTKRQPRKKYERVAASLDHCPYRGNAKYVDWMTHVDCGGKTTPQFGNH